ncbi:uncharacterized protein LOC126553269 [Aphis gossypii]|uniref:uncharacterized protein LOC126553269 n=1 Tax=Aphis gossypii TaxID=80765 RepID=UPI002158F4FA|nr:uncharacterized protein LOC126553269 [Aphis gossypii]
MTRKVNQDVVENMFSFLKGICGAALNNITPLQFKYALRWYILGKHSTAVYTENKNTEDGIENSLISGEECVTSSMFRQSEVLINETDYSQNEELANIMSVEGSVTIKNVDMNILDLFEKNIENEGSFGDIENKCVEYVAGYVAHRFIYKYPYLKNEECNSTQETSWIQHLS